MSLNVPPADRSDPIIGRLVPSLVELLGDSPGAEVDLQRAGPHSVRIRVIDVSLDGKTPRQRHDAVWSYLADLSPADLSAVAVIDAVTPEEADESPFADEFRPSAATTTAAA